jgi:hypothetical protein
MQPWGYDLTFLHTRTMGVLEIVSLSLPAAFGIVGGLWIIYLVTSTYLSYRKLRHIKGPWLASISPLWMFYYTCRGTLYLAVEDALKKYGKELFTTMCRHDFLTIQLQARQ